MGYQDTTKDFELDTIYEYQFKIMNELYDIKAMNTFFYILVGGLVFGLLLGFCL